MITQFALILLSMPGIQNDAWTKLQERLKAANAIQATLEIPMGPQKQKMEVRILRPNYMLVKMGPMELYFDGKEGWMYMPASKQYAKSAMGQQLMKDMPVPGLEGFWPGAIKPVAGPIAEKVEGTTKYWVTTLTYPENGAMAGLIVEMFLNPETGLPSKMNASRQGKSEGTAVYSELLIDPPLKAEDFKFTPPAGATDMQPGAGSGAPPDYTKNLLKVGAAAPDFKLKTPEGSSIGLKSTAAKAKAVLVNFWFYG